MASRDGNAEKDARLWGIEWLRSCPSRSAREMHCRRDALEKDCWSATRRGVRCST